MFTVTKAAAKQIRRSAASSDTEEFALRVAAVRTGDGGIDYRMGFDEVGIDDALLSTNGVDVVIAASDKELLNGTVLDYVELGARRPPLHLPQPQRSPSPPALRMNDPGSDTADRPDPPAGPRTVLDRFVMPADDWARDDGAYGPRTVDVLMGAMLAALVAAAGAAVAWYQGVAGGGSAFIVIAGALVVAAALALVTMRRVRRDLHRPLSELNAWALGMCSGDFSTRVPAYGESAYRKLAFHINRLSESLERLANDMDDVVWQQTERLRERRTNRSSSCTRSPPRFISSTRWTRSCGFRRAR